MTSFGAEDIAADGCCASSEPRRSITSTNTVNCFIGSPHFLGHLGGLPHHLQPCDSLPDLPVLFLKLSIPLLQPVVPFIRPDHVEGEFLDLREQPRLHVAQANALLLNLLLRRNTREAVMCRNVGLVFTQLQEVVGLVPNFETNS